MSEDREDSGIKVVDKRRFNPDGSQKDEKAKAPREEAFKDEIPPEISPSEGSVFGLQETSFANLILSLAASAQMNLGIAPNPFTHKVEKDLNQAKQTIDLLGILEEKTKGNLSSEEASLMQVILSDLRMRYVEEKKK